MDKLEHMFRLQAELDQSIISARGLEHSAQEWIQKKSLALIVELGEVLDQVKYKWWKNPTPLDRAALCEELVDVTHFLISMCIDAGMTADELYQIYLAKNAENHARQRGQSPKTGYEIC